MKTKAQKLEQEEFKQKLREVLTPGDTIHTVLRHVSRSGMCLFIDCYHFTNKNGKLEKSWLSYWIAKACGFSFNKEGREGIKIGGCGMDMGFHIVHSLGYALYGEQAQNGKGAAANKLRRQLFKADPHYYTQGGAKAPNPNKPDRLWFGGSGYAFKQEWL